MIKINKAHEYVKLATRHWLWKIHDSLNFCWKWVNSIAVDKVPQKFDSWHTKNRIDTITT